MQGRWKPELEKIVAKVTCTFSRSFAKIGCAGEVALHMAEAPGGGVDYNRCAINIKCGALLPKLSRAVFPQCTLFSLCHPHLSELSFVCTVMGTHACLRQVWKQ